MHNELVRAVAVVSFLAAALLAQNPGIEQATARVQSFVAQAKASMALERPDEAGARKNLCAALDLLDEVDRGCANPDAWWPRFTVGLAAYDVDQDAGQRAWEGVVRFFDQASKEVVAEKLSYFQTARETLAAILEQKRRFADAIALREKMCTSWDQAGMPIDAARARAYLGQALVLTGDAKQGLRGLTEFAAALPILQKAKEQESKDQESKEVKRWAEAAHLFVNAMIDMGQVLDERVSDLQRQILACYRESAPDPMALVNVLWERGNVLKHRGEYIAARNSAQESLELAEKEFGADDLRTFWPRKFYANVLSSMGDLDLALHYQEKCRDLATSKLPERHGWRMHAWNGCGHTLMLKGRTDEAIAAFKNAMAAIDPDEKDPTLLSNIAVVHDNLGQCYADSGRAMEAKALLEQAIAKAGEHPVMLAVVQGGMGMALQRAGELTEAAKYFEKSVPVVLRTQGSYQKMNYLRRQSQVLAALGNKQGLQKSLESLIGFAVQTAQECHTLPGRVSYQLAGIADLATHTVLSLAKFAEKQAELEKQAFEALETLRGIEVRATHFATSLAGDQKFQEQRRKAWAARAELASLASRGEGSSEDFLTAASARERYEFDALYKSLEARKVVTRLTLADAAKNLPEGAAAVAWRVVTLVEPDPKKKGAVLSEERFEAHVVTKPAGFVRVDLGPADKVREAVRKWSKAIDGGELRGRPGEKPKGPDPADELSALVLGPIKGKLGKAKVLIACLDDVLHMVPIELLPDAEKNGYEFRFAVSLTDLLPDAPVARPASLFAIGGLDFDKKPGEDKTPSPAPTASAADVLRGMSESKVTDNRWRPIEHSLDEVKFLCTDFKTRFGAGAVMMTGTDVSRAVFVEQAQKARYLHFATHGYFLPPGDDLARYEQVSRLAPMALCGLTLSGANKTGADFLGVITGEEIAALDLRGCEMAVLSTCESYVGTSRAGHGLASLQSAFHAAGARCVIASRWQVPDAATKELMSNFYSKLWEGKGCRPREALLHARNLLRNKKKPVKDWAGFILTGDLK